MAQYSCYSTYREPSTTRICPTETLAGFQDEPKSRKSSKIRKIFFDQIVLKSSETYKKSIFSKNLEKKYFGHLDLVKFRRKFKKNFFSQIVLKLSDTYKNSIFSKNLEKIVRLCLWDFVENSKKVFSQIVSKVSNLTK